RPPSAGSPGCCPSPRWARLSTTWRPGNGFRAEPPARRGHRLPGALPPGRSVVGSVDGTGVRGEAVLVRRDGQVLGGDPRRGPVELLLVVQRIGVVLQRGGGLGRPAPADALVTRLHRDIGF